MKESEIEWFRPLWLRVLVTALVAVWFGYEVFFSHETVWMVVTGAALAYAVWNLFIKFDTKSGKADANGGGDGKPKA